MDYPDFSVCDRVISSRWMLPILSRLKESQRFGGIQESLTGLSRSVLSAQLLELRQMELLQQKRFEGFPPRVEYQLTEKGRGLLEILSRLQKGT